MTTSSLDELCRKFCLSISPRHKKYLESCEEEQWFLGAYLTFNRTLRREGPNRPLTSEQKDKCREFLFEELKRLSAQNFDNDLTELLTRLVNDFKLSLGNSQKLVSVVLKYAFVMNELGHRCPLSSVVEKNKNKLPVPIDVSVIRNSLKNYGAEFKCLLKDGPPKVIEGDKPVSWSRLTSIQTYWELQTLYPKLAHGNGVFPIEFEMRKLWA